MRQKKVGRESLFKKVKETIKPVRKQGDPPEEDLELMDGYVCDLCKAPMKRSEIIQCPFCGRWICRRQCYNAEELCCKSCAGVIKLMRESVVLSDLPGGEPVEPEKKG
jgi:hypothetical protein